MGLLYKLKRAVRGSFTAVEPAPGTQPAPVEDVRRRLLAISGKGVQTAEDDAEIVVSWSAKGVGIGDPNVQYFYRALRITLDPERRTAFVRGRTKDVRAELEADGFSLGGVWTRGQQFGFEDVDVLAWPGPQGDEPADERFRFNWSQLREPAIEAVTGAGWTFKPKQL